MQNFYPSNDPKINPYYPPNFDPIAAQVDDDPFQNESEPPKFEHYTTGELLNKKMLLNHKGVPIANRSTIQRIVREISVTSKPTPWGMAKTMTRSQVDAWNKKQSQFFS